MERPAPLLLCEVVGGTSVSIGDDRLAAEGELVFALALYLGLNAGEEIQRDDVAHLLWPQHDDEAARHCLRQLLYRLRVLGLVVNARGDALDLSPECVRTDYAGLLASEPSREAYLAVLRFDVLPGYMPTFSQPFVRWVEEFRERLGLRLRNGLVACISDARSRGRYRDVAQLARHCLALDPLNEEATLGLAEATALVGSKVAAVQMLEAYRSDIGDAPGLRLQADLLRRRIAERLNVYGQPSDDVPMIGREDAMEYVLRGVHELSSGRARSLLITGEAGVGKTRLLGEFARVTAMHNVRTVFFRCHQGWREQPLAAITDLVTTLLQLPGALGASPDAMSALRELTTALPRRSDIGMYAGDADAMLANLRWSVLDLFEAVMQERKLVLLVDNVQWLDELSEHFLDYVVSRCAKRPLYLVMTSREGGDVGVPDTKRPLLATEHRLVLKPLDDDASRALVRHVVELADRELSDASVDSCVRRCGGNPYFLSELARFYMVSGPDSEPPVTLRMFIEYRLSKVSSSARRALEVVAILGSFATLRRIRSVLGIRNLRLVERLEPLQRASFIDFRGDACELRHDIVREIVASSLTPLARRVIHLRAATVLFREARLSESAVLLAECAQHLLSSGDTGKAPRGALFLSRRLLRLGAAERSAEIAALVYERTEDAPIRARALATQIAARRLLGDWPAVSALKSAYLGLRTASGRMTTATDLQLIESVLALAPAVHEHASELLERADTVATHPTIRLRLVFLGMQRSAGANDVEGADRCYEILQRISPTSLTQRMLWQTCRMIYQAEFGSTSSALEAAEQLATDANECLVPQERGVAWRRAAACLYMAGRLREAAHLCQRAADVFRQIELYSEAVFCLEIATNCYLFLDEHSEARRLLKEAKECASRNTRDIRMTFVLFCMETAVAGETGDRLVVTDAVSRLVRSAYKEQIGSSRLALVRGLLLHALRRRQKKTAHGFLNELGSSCLTRRPTEALDLAASLCCVGFTTEGREQDAKAFAATYLKNRASRPCPVLPSLTRHALRLGCVVQS